MPKTLIDIYIGTNGNVRRHMSLSTVDHVVRGTMVVSSRDQALKVVQEEIDVLLPDVEFVRVFDTYTMSHTDYEKS